MWINLYKFWTEFNFISFVCSMAHKKAAGSAKNLRDSKPKYRGVKVFGGQSVIAGNIILRQKWSKYICGKNTYMGKDFSIHADMDGYVFFSRKAVEKFNWRKYDKTVVSVVDKIEKNTADEKIVANKKKAVVVKKPAVKNSTVKKIVAKKTAVKKTAVKKTTTK